MKKLIKKLTPKFILKWYHLALAYSGAIYYGFPSEKLIVIGVLGTRGKTTTANLIWSSLMEAGYKTGLTGTAVIRIGSKERLNEYHMTMPGRFTIQKILREMVDAGCKYAVIETPSEGVEQSRHKGIAYDVALLTTLYPEYLEVHNWDYERCLEMHLKVFAELMGRPHKIIDGKKIPKIIVVNNDNAEAEEFLKFEADKKITYGLKSQADFTAMKIKATRKGVDFLVGQRKFHLDLLGSFNVQNALAAIAVLSGLEIGEETIRRGLKNLKNVPGRMEKIETGQNFSVFIDYAHDKNSMEAALRAAEELKPRKSSKIIILLGAEGGGRDKKKRPVMGELTAKSADFVVVSNVDPYDDDPIAIMEDIARAAEKFGKVRGKDLFVIEDRRAGIRKALSLAREGDVVLITGKGTEQSMIVAGGEIPWDDREITRQELASLP